MEFRVWLQGILLQGLNQRGKKNLGVDVGVEKKLLELD